jgi:23S rRNA pseudouridine2457 synthase
MSLILFNKPFQVLCQFSPQDGKATLADHLTIPKIYPAGRLDYDSEGLMLLTDDGKLQHAIAHPDHKAGKTYLVQVEGIPDEAAMAKLQAPLDLGDFTTQPCKACASPSRNGCGRAIRRSASAPASPPAGWPSRCRKARTARCGA